VPTGLVRRKFISCAAMLDPYHAPAVLTGHSGEAVDSADNPGEVMFRRSIQQPDLHVDDNDCVHWLSHPTRTSAQRLEYGMSIHDMRQ
jgi:hypothetical protein